MSALLSWLALAHALSAVVKVRTSGCRPRDWLGLGLGFGFGLGLGFGLGSACP